MKKFVSFVGDTSPCTVEWVNDEDVDGYQTVAKAQAEADRLNALLENAEAQAAELETTKGVYACALDLVERQVSSIVKQAAELTRLSTAAERAAHFRVESTNALNEYLDEMVRSGVLDPSPELDYIQALFGTPSNIIYDCLRAALAQEVEHR